MNTPLTTIQAVQCVQCSMLHSVDGTSYLTIEGIITRRRAIRSTVDNQQHHLGSKDKPTVLCNNHTCLPRFLRIDEDE